MTYSIDFRKRVLSFVQEGHLQDNSPRKLPKGQLLAYVEQHPDAYLREIAKHFSCAINAVWKALRKYNITLKKTTNYREQDSEKVRFFLAVLAVLVGLPIVYINCHYLYRKNGCR